MSAKNTLEYIAGLYASSRDVLQRVRDGAVERRSGPQSVPRFTLQRVSGMVGRSVSAIRDAESDGRLPSPTIKSNGHRAGYTLAEVNRMRAVFGTRISRGPNDEPAVIAVTNFKGGVGKSTTAVHLSQNMARRGYRTLLVDCDSQASSTGLFGYVPDMDVDEEDTIAPFLREIERPDLRYAIRETHWDGLHLIPANLRLYAVEYELAASFAQRGRMALERLAQGIASVAGDYDIVIIDSPPALGTISLSVMQAANALLIPVPPTVMDFSSTSSFFSMLGETIQTMDEHDMPVRLNWIKILLSRVDDGKSIQKGLSEMMRQLFGDVVMRASMRNSAEIDNASARLMSVYELEKPITSSEVHNRALRHLDAVCAEIEVEIRKSWPSHTKALQDDAVI